ncbi:MAG: type 4a pilus biogenesis protein PilO [Patescibacteria group bacterium]|nr:type 4a pilus biogenesis protein PilO [Patescibacteria group bacterium]
MVARLLTKTRSALRKIHYQRKANFFLTLSALLFVAVFYYGVTGYLELSEKSDIVEQSAHGSADIGTSLEDAESEYRDLSETHDTLKETVRGEILNVFPEQEQYTELTRKLDDYFTSVGSSKSLLVANNLQFGSSRVSEDENYYVLPINMTITASEDNFYNFLNFIHQSGSLSSQTRIMDIRSIKINFRSPGAASGAEEINFNVQLNAYYQKID